MEREEQRAALAMWTCAGVGAVAFERLAAAVPMREWLSTPWAGLVKRLSVSDEAKAALVEVPLEARLRTVLRQLHETGQRVCFRGDKTYPVLLSRVREAPPLLFFKGPGAVSEPRARVAIVGTRNTTDEWLEWTRRLAGACAEQGLVVVSGGADGIDTAAHTGAVQAHGESWAFVASSLDQLDVAPAGNARRLLDAGGSVFTEFPPGVRSNPGRFVHRNRLISGSAEAVVAVRGAHDSGARHTAAAAREQGRAVLAVPSDPISRAPGGELSTRLLREGARPCFDATDVLASCGLVPMPKAAPLVAERGPVSESASAVFHRLPAGLFDIERAIAATPELGTGMVSAAIMELELAGWLVSRTGRRYEKRE